MQNSSIRAIAEHQQAAAAETPSPSLFDRIGGMRRVEELVERFVAGIRSDPELAPSLGRVDVAFFKRSQAAFFTEAFGGHFPDRSLDLRRAHFQLDGEKFFRAALLLYDTLLSLDLSSDLQEKLLLAVISHALTAREVPHAAW